MGNTHGGQYGAVNAGYQQGVGAPPGAAGMGGKVQGEPTIRKDVSPELGAFLLQAAMDAHEEQQRAQQALGTIHLQLQHYAKDYGTQTNAIVAVSSPTSGHNPAKVVVAVACAGAQATIAKQMTLTQYRNYKTKTRSCTLNCQPTDPRAHQGVFTVFENLKERVVRAVQQVTSPQHELLVTGIGVAASVAQLLAFELWRGGFTRNMSVYAFGPIPAFNHALVAEYNHFQRTSFTFWQANDVIPTMAFANCSHVGQAILLDDDGVLKYRDPPSATNQGDFASVDRNAQKNLHEYRQAMQTMLRRNGRHFGPWASNQAVVPQLAAAAVGGLSVGAGGPPPGPRGAPPGSRGPPGSGPPGSRGPPPSMGAGGGMGVRGPPGSGPSPGLARGPPGSMGMHMGPGSMGAPRPGSAGPPGSGFGGPPSLGMRTPPPGARGLATSPPPGPRGMSMSPQPGVPGMPPSMGMSSGMPSMGGAPGASAGFGPPGRSMSPGMGMSASPYGRSPSPGAGLGPPGGMSMPPPGPRGAPSPGGMDNRISFR